MVGWAAASGTAPLNAWLLVAIIFLWTPPHFWALSLYTRGDYAAAGRADDAGGQGAASTRRQILAYSVVLALAALAPAFTDLGGQIYLAVAALGGAVFVALAVRLAEPAPETTVRARRHGPLRTPKSDVPARDLFAFSIVYLFALFAALLVEHLRRLVMSDPDLEDAEDAPPGPAEAATSPSPSPWPPSWSRLRRHRW